MLAARETRLQRLMVRAVAGDDAAYRDLLTQLSASLRAFYRRRLVNLPAEVEDLVQETLLAIHNQRHTYDVDRPFTAWCFGIARYKLVDLLRRRARAEALTDPLNDERELLDAQDPTSGDARRDLLGLLDTLPDRQRLPIVHVKIEGRSVAETAQLTGISESAVKVGIHRGLKALAKLVGADS
jgi:RNA polymerase sigma-70 factor (ECF subfamily)